VKKVICLGKYDQWHQRGYIYSANGISPTICATDYKTPKLVAVRGGLMNNLRIRKLTPKECWRLMGFKDEDFDKAEKENSNTQLYKQAGNSIVVPVLENILSNLLLK
jgi:DNA (cytosine-5)-methyltransferase 1